MAWDRSADKGVQDHAQGDDQPRCKEALEILAAGASLLGHSAGPEDLHEGVTRKTNRAEDRNDVEHGEQHAVHSGTAGIGIPLANVHMRYDALDGSATPPADVEERGRVAHRFQDVEVFQLKDTVADGIAQRSQ